MLKQCEGSQAVAEAIGLCRPQVICAYPITPQTHIVEGLGSLVKSGKLANCEYINVESEFAAMSVAIGASAAGARAYTATASQGILYMAEAVYNAGGLGLPIVMTVGNRSIGAPINIWNDHTDSMALRDAGWIQLFAEDNQEAVDLHIQAFKLAEELSVPVMVCMDGFILTHAYERVDIPTQEQVDAFLPPYEPRQVVDPDDPVTIGAMVGPEAFMEVRYLAHAKQLQALERIPELAGEFKQKFGRDSGGLIREYRADDAETIVVGLGSVNGTIKDVVDDMRKDGMKIGNVSIGSFRPFPTPPNAPSPSRSGTARRPPATSTPSSATPPTSPRPSTRSPSSRTSTLGTTPTRPSRSSPRSTPPGASRISKRWSAGSTSPMRSSRRAAASRAETASSATTVSASAPTTPSSSWDRASGSSSTTTTARVAACARPNVPAARSAWSPRRSDSRGTPRPRHRGGTRT
jgi:pyruvate ferredoxin oxidoreductase alpha subunit